MKYYVIDIETNGLTNPDTIWCLVVEELDSDSVHSFTDREDFYGWLKDTPKDLKFIGHNIIEFDKPWLQRLWGIDLGDDNLIDTLILSRLYSPKLEGGHSLEAWGERLNSAKISFDDFDKYSEEMLTYCKQDVSLTKKLYLHLKKKKLSDFAIEIEHKVVLALRDAKTRGFYFDLSKAIDLKIDLEKIRDELDVEMIFPDVEKVEWFIPKKDNEKKGYKAGVPFKKLKYVEFNPNSAQHVINECWKAGWKPTEKTEGHKEFLKESQTDDEEAKKKRERYAKFGWKLSETNLATLPEDAPKALRAYLKRLIYETRIRKLDEWINLVGDDGAVHGNIISLGTWTHRMAHQNPNLANISAKKSIKYHTKELKEIAEDLGGKLRSLWIARPGYVLVGTDAEGIQLRVLAHYMNDPEFTEAVTKGNKDEGTDPHSFNQRQIGIGTRDNAKTFIYAFLLGAGDAKIGEIYNITSSAGRNLKERYIESMPGLAKLKRDRIPTEARQGYTFGFDGRRILCNSDHLMMAAYLQGGETVIMKLAVVLAVDKLKQEKIPAYLINVVHDEMIFETTEHYSQRVREITEWSIGEAGIKLKLNCPQKGEGKIGKTWLDVH